MSSETGQRALLMQRSVSNNINNGDSSGSLFHGTSILSYDVPSKALLVDRSAMKSGDKGLQVLKVSKTGGMQTRRVGFTMDRRKFMVTSRRIRNVKGLIKLVAASGSATTIQEIHLHYVDHIDVGPYSQRFIQLEEKRIINSVNNHTTSPNSNTNNSNSRRKSNGSNHSINNHHHHNTHGNHNHHHHHHTDDDSELAEQVALFLEREQCISIYYYNPHIEKMDCLDLIVPDRQQFTHLVKSLKDLVILAKQELQQYTSILQYLHFQYMCLGKEWESRMTLTEWLTLTERIQTPVKKSTLTQMFKEESIHENDDKLSIIDIAYLLEELRTETGTMKDPMLRLWKQLVEMDPVPPIGIDGEENKDDDASLELSLRDSDESISAVGLLSFIRSHQKVYTATLEDVTELVHDLNKQISSDEPPSSYNLEIGANDRLTKSRFMSWLTSDMNDILDPEKCTPGYDDMSKPLSHYWINSSHDTYIDYVGESFHGKSQYAKYKNGPIDCNGFRYTSALHRGVRCLELDVWDDNHINEPVVGRNTTEKSIPLRIVLRSIRHYLNQNTHCFPIILKIENHCTHDMQIKISNQLYEYFGTANLIVKPSENQQLDTNVYLPSPDICRGKIIIMGKRPKRVKVGCSVLNDDLDSDNDGWDNNISTSYLQHIVESVEKDELDADSGIVIGFDTKGPIRSNEEGVIERSPSELLDITVKDAELAEIEAVEAEDLRRSFIEQANEKEKLAAKLTLNSGMSPEEVKMRASRATTGGGRESSITKTNNNNNNGFLTQEGRNVKEEGVEVHELLPSLVEGNQDAYAEAAQRSMEAASEVALLLNKLKEAERELERAEKDLEMSRELENRVIQNSHKAAAEARRNQEHADAANERIEKVKELLRNSEENASSAGNVVQTAMTEAQISEKRAKDAQYRAERALAVAEKDRLRAEEETRKEEELEHEVSELRTTCQESTEHVKNAKIQLEKSQGVFDRVNEQIKLIERSTQFLKEKEEFAAGQKNNFRHGGSLLAKHEAKMRERTKCRELIKDASEERSAAETRLLLLKSKFEEKARAWRNQASVASQARRNADRSAHVAEELAEHAAEEREAADLRQVAREKAVATVESRGSLRESVEAQLAEAERAAAEAAEIALQSRNRASKLEKEAERIRDHSRFIEAVSRKELDVRQAQIAYEAGLEKKREKDSAAEDEKRRLDTNSEVYRSSSVDTSVDGNNTRISVVQVLEQEAIVAYNAALILRRQVESATTKSDIATSVADAKRAAAEHARAYKERRQMLVDIPVALAKFTLLHTSRFLNWQRSLALSHAYSHSFAHNVLFRMMEKDSDEERANFEALTKHRMVRVFPPWKTMCSKTFSNCDPVLAWSLGCQLVAMNLGSPDENLLVADGRFRQNGSSGYVLKPKYLRENASRAEDEVIWTFSVLGAYYLPKLHRKIIRPRVRVSLYAGSTEATRIMYRTKCVDHNGFNPSWDERENYTFQVSNPSIAVVVFSVWDKQDDRPETFVAGSALPVSCLREGCRSIALFDGDHARTGPMRYATLLVKAVKR